MQKSHDNLPWMQEKDLQEHIQHKAIEQERYWTLQAQKNWMLLGDKHTEHSQAIATTKKTKLYIENKG